MSEQKYVNPYQIGPDTYSISSTGKPVALEVVVMPDEQTAREIIRQAFTEPIDDCNEWSESPLDCGARNALAALAEAGYLLTTIDEVRRIEIEYGESIALVSPDGSAAERSET